MRKVLCMLTTLIRVVVSSSSRAFAFGNYLIHETNFRRPRRIHFSLLEDVTANVVGGVRHR